MGLPTQVGAKTGKFLPDKGLAVVLDWRNEPWRRLRPAVPGLERFYPPGRQIDSFARDSTVMSGLTELIRDVRDHPDR